MTTQVKQKEYNADSISRHSGLLGIRKKASVYIGETNSHGLFTVLREVLDNTIDEFLARRNTEVTCILDADGSFWVADQGTGIPVQDKTFQNEHGKAEVLNTLYVVTGLTHGGAKFDAGGAYDSSRGCFTGDQKIRLLDGRIISFENLYKIWKSDKTPIPIMSYDKKTRKLVPSYISNVQITKKTRDLLDVKLSDNSVIRCTPDHPFFVLRGGSIRKVKAENLSNGDSCVATHYSKDKDGYIVQTENGVKRKTHRIVAEHFEDFTTGLSNVHHISRNTQDNTPSNLTILTQADHHREHSFDRSVRGREKILRDQEDLRISNSVTFTDQNSTEDHKAISKLTKAVKIATRCLRRTGKVNSTSWDLVRTNSEMKFQKAILAAGSLLELKVLAKERLALLESRVGLSLTCERELEYADTVVNNSVEHATNASYAAALSKWSRTLLDLEDPENATPHEFNFHKRSGDCVFGRYANMRRFTSLSNLKKHILHGEDMVWYEDTDSEAADRRVFAAEAKLRPPQSLTRTVSTFVTQLKKHNIFDKDSYLRMKSISSPKWDYALYVIEHLYGNYESLEQFVKDYNHSVMGISHVHLNNSVPVYDITVDNTHTFFVEPGVLVCNSHGIGIKATNALSEFFHVYTNYKGSWNEIRYEDASLKTTTRKIKSAPSLPHLGKISKGTVVHYKPEMKCFEPGSKFPMKELLSWAEMASYLNGGFTIRLINKDGKEKIFYSKEGSLELLKKMIETVKASPLEGKSVYVTCSNKELDLAVAFTDYDGTKLDGFTNGLSNPHGGLHVDGFYSALAKAIQPYKNTKHTFGIQELKEGIIGVINVKLAAPKFKTQTKEELIDTRVEEPVFNTCLETLTKFLAANKALARRLCDRASELKSLKNEFVNNKKALRELKTASTSRSALPKKLTMALRCKPEDRELFILEGDSALGNANSARDSAFQETLALRGKILNVMRAKKADRVFENEEVMNILKSIGYIPDVPDPMSKLRVGKIILTADADVDGPVVGETRVLLLNGTNPTIKELADKWELDQEPFLVYSRSSSGRLIPALGTEPKVAAVVDRLATLTLSSGAVFQCSVDHKWLVNTTNIEDARIIWYKENAFIRTEDLTHNDYINAVFSDSGKIHVSRLDRSNFNESYQVVSVIISECEPIPVYCLTVSATGNFMFDDGFGNGVCSANSHINALLCGCLFRFVPGVFQRGMVYVAKGFEYLAQTPQGNFFGDTIDEVKKQVPTKYHGYILHLKGLGESNPDALSHMVFNPSTRKLLRIKPFNKDGETRFKALMQENIDYREHLLGLD